MRSDGAGQYSLVVNASFPAACPTAHMVGVPKAGEDGGTASGRQLVGSPGADHYSPHCSHLPKVNGPPSLSTLLSFNSVTTTSKANNDDDDDDDNNY